MSTLADVGVMKTPIFKLAVAGAALKEHEATCVRCTNLKSGRCPRGKRLLRDVERLKTYQRA